MESTSHTANPETPGTPQPVIFTDAAIAKIRHFLDTKQEAQGKHLRVFVQGGGCSGFEYGFTFDVEKQGDVKIPQGDIEVIVDMFSLPYLEGSRVDYTESLMGSGFTVTNPNAKGTCGCGHSFTT